jgi:hypothetical protein
MTTGAILVMLMYVLGAWGSSGIVTFCESPKATTTHRSVDKAPLAALRCPMISSPLIAAAT